MPLPARSEVQSQSGLQIEDSRPKNYSTLDRIASNIGLGPLLPRGEVKRRFDLVQDQLNIGLQRPDDETPTRSDGGLLAIRTGIEPISAEDMRAVPVGTPMLVGEYGGTNLNVSVAEKQASGGVAIDEPFFSDEFAPNERAVPLAEHARRIGDPMRREGDRLGIHNFATSLGLMHTGERTKYGMEAHLITDTGVLDKGIVITDWNDIPASERGIVQEVNKSAQRRGIGIAINDTAGVALDGGAKVRAEETGFVVLDDGEVVGSGTNRTKVKKTHSGLVVPDSGPFGLNTPATKKQLINTEAGHADWPDDRVSQTMRKRLIELKYITPEKDHPELEYETGQYLPHRLVAGLKILAEESVINIGDVNQVGLLIEQRAKENPAFMSDLATGNERLTIDSDANELIEHLAQTTMRRAEDVYGIFMAIGTTPPTEAEQNKIFALPTEGSVLLKAVSGPGRPIRNGAQVEARKLTGRSVVVFPASGMEGVASLAMVLSNQKAA